MEPMLDELAKTYALRRVNVDEEHALAARFGVRAVPTMVLMKNGKVVEQIVGAVGRSKLETLLKRHAVT